MADNPACLYEIRLTLSVSICFYMCGLKVTKKGKRIMLVRADICHSKTICVIYYERVLFDLYN